MRFVFLPMHVDKKTGLLMPNFTDHVFTAGFSVQRNEMARLKELQDCVKGFLANKEKAAWLGVVVASVDELRACRISGGSEVAFGIYDSAEKNNPAHAEIAATRYAIEDPDRMEAQKHLLDCFGSGKLIPRESFFDGKVWNGLSTSLQQRPFGKIKVPGINA